MQTLELTALAASVRDALRVAEGEPLVLTESGEPKYVVRSLVEDDLADELIALDPDFLASIQLARQQKAEGRVKSLAEARRLYTSSDE